MGSDLHKFHHPFHQLYLHKRTLRELDIPPRKLLSRRIAAAEAAAAASDMFMDSPKGEDTLFQKFLPYNNVDDDDADPYSADQFRMFEFKVRKCTRSRSHDWTDCPFAHPGEKARRRDPRRYNYTGTVCSEFRRGSCSRGDSCEFAHGVFECWLHPSRYRTEACKDGKNCKRKVCFFAHTPRQLRILPVNCNDNVSSPMSTPAGIEKNASSRQFHHCCACCHNTVVASPNSTLMGISHMSPPISPPHSPPTKFSPISRFNDRFEAIESSGLNHLMNSGGGLSYKDAVNELMTSLEAMNVNEAAANVNNGKLSWVDVNFNGGDDQQQQFVLSPSTPSPSPAGSSRFSRGEFVNRSFVEDNNGGFAGPDLGWVNDLLT